MTRHRYIVPLYEDNPLDAEVLEYLAEHSKKARPDLMRSLMRAGFSVLVQKETFDIGKLASLDDEAIRAILNSLVGGNGAGVSKRPRAAKKRKSEKRRQDVADSNADAEEKNSDEAVSEPEVIGDPSFLEDGDEEDFNPLAQLQNLSEQ